MGPYYNIQKTEQQLQLLEIEAENLTQKKAPLSSTSHKGLIEKMARTMRAWCGPNTPNSHAKPVEG